MALIILKTEITKIGWMMQMLSNRFKVMEEVLNDKRTEEVIYRVKGEGIPEDDKVISVTIFQDEHDADKFEVKVYL